MIAKYLVTEFQPANYSPPLFQTPHVVA